MFHLLKSYKRVYPSPKTWPIKENSYNLPPLQMQDFYLQIWLLRYFLSTEYFKVLWHKLLNTLQKLLLQGSGSIHRILGWMTMRKFGEQPWKEIPVGTIKPACVCEKRSIHVTFLQSPFNGRSQESHTTILQKYWGVLQICLNCLITVFSYSEIETATIGNGKNWKSQGLLKNKEKLVS